MTKTDVRKCQMRSEQWCSFYGPSKPVVLQIKPGMFKQNRLILSLSLNLETLSLPVCVVVMIESTYISLKFPQHKHLFVAVLVTFVPNFNVPQRYCDLNKWCFEHLFYTTCAVWLASMTFCIFKRKSNHPYYKVFIIILFRVHFYTNFKEFPQNYFVYVQECIKSQQNYILCTRQKF